MRICIGVPHGGTVTGRLWTDLLLAVMNTPNTNWQIANLEGSLGPHNRWLAAKHALETHSDYLWLVDNDMGVPSEALPRLLAADKDIIGAAYNYRRLPLCSTVKFLDEDGKIIIADSGKFPNEPFPCYAIGSGCKLIKVEALKRIPQPWFKLEWNEDTGELIKTDDVWFCGQAHKAGIEVWCDPTIRVTHIGAFAY